MYNLFKKKWFKFTYRDWVAYFQRNDKKRLVIDFSEEPELAFKAKDLIFPSIMAFQKGEHSEGYQFTEMAKNFAKDRKEPYYSDAVNLFIREENFHSAYLAEYMNFYGIKKATENSLDKAFRSMRHSGGLFGEVSILVTAEIIALTYYTALGNVADKVGSPALKQICNQMLHDELPHIVFQSYTLSHYPDNIGTRLFRKIVMEGTTIFVYATYGNLIKKGGYSYRRFRKENMGYLDQSIQMVKLMKAAL